MSSGKGFREEPHLSIMVLRRTVAHIMTNEEQGSELDNLKGLASALAYAAIVPDHVGEAMAGNDEVNTALAITILLTKYAVEFNALKSTCSFVAGAFEQGWHAAERYHGINMEDEWRAYTEFLEYLLGGKNGPNG